MGTDAGAASKPSAGPDAARAAGPAAAPPAKPAAKADDAINLGSTVLPILLRTYWKYLAVLVVVVVVVVLVVSL
jgi:hypothetical protein